MENMRVGETRRAARLEGMTEFEKEIIWRKEERKYLKS